MCVAVRSVCWSGRSVRRCCSFWLIGWLFAYLIGSVWSGVLVRLVGAFGFVAWLVVWLASSCCVASGLVGMLVWLGLAWLAGKLVGIARVGAVSWVRRSASFGWLMFLVRMAWVIGLVRRGWLIWSDGGLIDTIAAVWFGWLVGWVVLCASFVGRGGLVWSVLGVLVCVVG